MNECNILVIMWVNLRHLFRHFCFFLFNMKAVIAEGAYKAAEFEASKLVVKNDFPIPEPEEGFQFFLNEK